MLEIIILAYVIWAFYSGWQFMTGRIEYLDQKKIVPIIIKLLLSFAVGIFYGAIRFITLILTFLGVMSKI